MAAVSDFTALLSGERWSGMTGKGAPVFVSYSFLSDGEVPSLAEYEPYTNSGYTGFTAAQKTNFKKALAKFEAATGIKFIEVDDPDNAMIKVMNTSGAVPAGWADYGIATSTHSNTGYLVIDGTGTYAPGTSEFETILHELGHSSGLKHPFSGDPTLVDSLENEDHTLMSYTSNGVMDTDLAHLDKDALHDLYGMPSGFKGSWSWSWSDATSTFKLNGGNGNDVLIGIHANSKINGKGGKDKIFGRDGDDVLRGGGGKDTLGDGDGDDKLFGDGGNDTFILSTGDNTYNGGAGNDTMDFSSFKSPIWLDLSKSGGQVTGYGTNAFKKIENIEGGKGKDRLTGDSKKNKLDGNGGNDTIFGGGNNDRIEGGKGKDSLTGGPGKDKFIYKNKFNKDTIVDFEDNVDTVLLAKNLWNGSKSLTEVLNQFGKQKGSDFVLDFGGKDILKILDATKSDLMNDVGFA